MLSSLTLKNSFSQKVTFFIVLIVSVSAATISFFAEHILEMKPCFLCLTQRSLHLLLILAATLGILSSSAPLAKRMCQIILICNLAVASYHGLVQFKLVEDRCVKNAGVESIESYKKHLISNKRTQSSCSDKSLSIKGIPISAFNGLISICLFGLLIKKREWSSTSFEE